MIETLWRKRTNPIGFFRALALFSLSAGGGLADDVAGAGRIDFARSGGSCSGALVAPDIVVTAAHCVPALSAGEHLENLSFTPGSRVPSESHAVAGAARHPLYSTVGDRPGWLYRFDVGLIRLSESVPPEIAAPFAVGAEAQAGETLYLVSWRRGDGPRPRQRACPVLSAGLRGLVTLGCPVVGGESGAPLFRKTSEGLELVAVVSSRTRLLDQPVAQASDVRLRLPPLLDLIDETGS